jgi:hypothetical protein
MTAEATPPAPVAGPDGDSFDVAGAQRAAAVDQPALDDGAVADQRAVLPGQRVQAAEGVVPVRVVEGAVERLVEQPPDRREDLPRHVGGVPHLDRHHAGILAARSSTSGRG